MNDDGVVWSWEREEKQNSIKRIKKNILEVSYLVYLPAGESLISNFQQYGRIFNSKLSILERRGFGNLKSAAQAQNIVFQGPIHQDVGWI